MFCKAPTVMNRDFCYFVILWSKIHTIQTQRGFVGPKIQVKKNFLSFFTEKAENISANQST